MKILVACEESGVVTEAFRNKGHEAWSCDLYATSGKHPEWHIQGDVTPLLEEQWDMIIAFPPCTHLCVSGAKHWKEKIADGRQAEGIKFFMLFANAKCPKVAIENPVGIMSTIWRKPDQIINPWQFGHPEYKKTCLWLKGLPLLIETKNVKKYADAHPYEAERLWRCPLKGEERSRYRSKTYPGIALAMAEQWG